MIASNGVLPAQAIAGSAEQRFLAVHGWMSPERFRAFAGNVEGEVSPALQASYRQDSPTTNFYATDLASDNRTLTLGSVLSGGQIYLDTYDLTTYINGKFSTGSLKHQLVFGFALNRYDFFRFRYSVGSSAQLDLFNPVYPRQPGPATFRGDTSTLTDTLGVYVQDQVALAENLKLLLGVRFDTLKQTNEDFVADTKTSQSDNAFSPRVGIGYYCRLCLH